MLKKSFVLLAVTVLLLSLVCLPAMAEPCRIFENDPISVPNAKPTIDGKIDPSEGWSKVARLDEQTAAHFYQQMQLTNGSDLYFAVSDEGLYFAAYLTEGHGAYTCRLYEENAPKDVGYFPHDYIDANAGDYSIYDYPATTPDGTVIDGHMEEGFKTKTPADAKVVYWYGNSGNTNCYSQGSDMMDKIYAFDGDVFALQIDPLGLITADGHNGQEYCTQFNFGIFKGDVVKMKTSIFSDIDYTDKCKLAGSLTSENIIIEAFIPKDVVVTELNTCLKSYGIGEITWEQFTASGSTTLAEVTLMDRFEDPEAGIMDSWGRYSTVCAVTNDGNDGWRVDVYVKGLGLKLNMPGVGSSDNPAPDTGNSGDNNNQNQGNGNQNQAQTTTAAANNNAASTTKAAASTTKSASTGASSQTQGSGEASQTFDAGIAIALGALACSGIGIVYTNKKRHK